MISPRIRSELEKSLAIRSALNKQSIGVDWSLYTRTIFMIIAKVINKNVTQKVILNPDLIKECLLIGENEIEKILFREMHSSIDGFILSLKSLPLHRTHNWISGKTLQSYWNGTNAKDKKINVLLTYLDIHQKEWDDWKGNNFSITPNDQKNFPIQNREHSNYLLRKYYLGGYYRYYQKADGSATVVKTPFILKEDDDGNVVAKSKTIGHKYESYSIEISDGALYIDLKNIDWEEREHHIFNIGIATSPKVLIGVSNSLNNRKQAIAKRNVLIRQNDLVDYDQIQESLLPYDMNFKNTCDDSIAVDFFKRRKNNLIVTSLYYNLDELEVLNHQPI